MSFLKLMLLLAASVSMSSCQTMPKKETSLVVVPGVFQPKDFAAKKSRTSRSGKEEWITANNNDQFAGVMLNVTNNLYVIELGITLSKRHLRVWNYFKEGQIDFGVETNINTPLGKIPVVKFSYKNNQCIYFRYLFKKSGRDAVLRFRNDLNGYFCENSSHDISDKVISDFLHQVGVTKYYNPTPTTATAVSTRSPSSSEQKISNLSDIELCRIALIKGKGSWNLANNIQIAEISEARDRNLTPQKCAELTDRTKTETNTSSSTSSTNDGKPEDIQLRLKKLKSLIDQGLITEEDAASKRKEILEGL